MNVEESVDLQRVRKVLGEWLASEEFRWSSFGTFTFRGIVPRRPIQCFERVMDYIRGTGRAGTSRAFVCCELGKRTDRAHLHALIEHSGVMGVEISQAWSSRYGHASVRRYNPQLGGVRYVTKYVIKEAGQNGDWTIQTTCGLDAVDDLFERASVMTGYELYTDYMRALRKKERN